MADEQKRGIFSVLPSLILAGGFGAAAYCLPGFFIQSSSKAGLRPAEGMCVGCLALMLSVFVFPWTIKWLVVVYMYVVTGYLFCFVCTKAITI